MSVAYKSIVNPFTGKLQKVVDIDYVFATPNTWTGIQTIRRDGLGVNSGDGIVYDNQTPATGVLMQASPRRRMRGRGFNSATSTSFPFDFADHVIGIVSNVKYGKYRMMQSDDGTTWKEAFSYSTDVAGEGFKITTPTAQSNGQAGTTRIVTLENSGQNTYIDFTFSGVKKGAIGVSSSGEVNVFATGSNGLVIWTGGTIGSQTSSHYLYNGGILITGTGGFSGRVSAGTSTTNPKHFLQANGRMGHKARLAKTNTTLTTSDHILYVDTSTSSQCTGTPTYACSAHTSESDCTTNAAHGGCSWSGGSCSTYNGDESNCNSHSGCTWETVSCSGIIDEYSCNGTSGCSWSSTPNDCGSFGDQMTCEGYSGCSWSAGSDCSTYNNNQSSCEGTSGCGWSPSYDGDCTAFTDESSCTANSGCSWDGSSCTGGYYIGNGICSGSYGTGCSGTYYTYNCTGSYPTGNCTGSYGNCTGTSSCASLDNSQCTNESGCSWTTGQTTFLPQITPEMDGDIGPDYIIKKVGGSGNVVITPYAGDNIDGASSKTITTNYTGYRLHGFIYREDCSVWEDQGNCEGNSGCTWYTSCTGSNEEDCTAVSGCSWDSGSSTCSGSAGSCSGTYISQKRWHVVGVF